jgi:hypothetical protein
MGTDVDAKDPMEMLGTEVRERLERIVALPEPGVERPMEQLVWQFAQQARASLLAGSPMYAVLLLHAIVDLEAEGVTWRLVRDHVAPGRGNAIALRVMAAVHRHVLTGQAPTLERFFASTGGSDSPHDAWPPFLAHMEEHEDALIPLVRLGCQTNEPGRASALMIGLLHVAERFPHPVDLVEIGCAGGLNLRLDHFRYGGDGQAWGDPDSPVDLTGFWVDVDTVPDVRVEVASRLGVDPFPIDPTTEEGRLAITSSVWGDQAWRFRVLDGAFALARSIPAPIVESDGVEWVEQHLATTPGRTTVLMQSVMREYLSEEAKVRLDEAVAAVGATATEDAPLAWIELEPITLIRRHGLRVTMWPGGEVLEPVTMSSLGPDVRRRLPG